jgi:hypothetical protein
MRTPLLTSHSAYTGLMASFGRAAETGLQTAFKERSRTPKYSDA